MRPADLLKGDVQYRAPVFQRHFVWGKKQFDLLWNDLELLQEIGGEVESRFLGALVLEDQGGGLATDPDEYVIVDGQQRLLTLYLALIAIAERAQHLGEKGETFSRDLARQFLVNQGSKIAGQGKVIPTIEDFSQYRSVLQALTKVTSITLPAPYGPVSGALTSMYERVRGAVEVNGQLAGDDSERLDYLETIAGTVLNSLKFVEIVLGDEDDPHHVFDRLNDAGIKLDVADLVRNDVFQRMANQPEEATKLHRNRWMPFEASLSGHLGEFAFPYALIKKSSTTKGRMMADLRAAWGALSGDQVIDDLQEYVASFAALTAGSLVGISATLPSSFLRQIGRLSRMPLPSSALPYTMMVVRETEAGSLSPVDGERDLLLVESFLVRRALAGIEPTGLHALFKVMWERTKGDPALLVKEIDSRPTIQFPDDSAFAADIRIRPLYGRKLARYVLVEYDRALPGDPTPEDPPTIDHVMPRKLPASWSVPAKEHARCLDLWANLVPLSGPGNAAKRNDPWSKVQARLVRESAFKTPRALALRYSTWGPAEIDLRTAELILWGVERWPRR